LIIKCQWIQFIFYNDPYFFRAQIFMFMPLMIYSLVIEFISLGLTRNYVGVVQNFGTTIILNTVQVSILLLVDVVFPLTMTLIELFRMCVMRSKLRNVGMDEYFKDPYVEKLFLDFCEREYSLENILCYKDIQEYKKTLKDPLSIYFRYLNGNSSTMEVNISRRQCNSVYEKLKSGSFDITLFAEVETAIIANLSDTWSRFESVGTYVRHLQTKKSELEMIEGK
jgi:hypothetical protein